MPASIIMKKTPWLFIILIFLTHACIAQYSMKGKVVDEQQQPLQSVSVTVGKKTATALTDSLGNFSFNHPASTALITFTHVGYEPVTIHITAAEFNTVTLVKNNYSLSETVVNSFEKNSHARNIAAAVTILNKTSLERYENGSFVAAINTVTGVKMDERSPGSYRLSIRGNLLRSTFGVRNVKVYWNGIPFTDANGNTYINEIASNNIGKIEILKGPSGSMYGSGTGGVVLLSSNLSVVKGKTFSLQTTAGSYGLFSANASYDQSGSNSISSLSFSHQQSDGYRKHTNMRRDVANFNGTYFISPKQNISANIFYSDLYYQTPGALTVMEMKADPRQARPAAGVNKSAEAQKAALYLKTMYAGFGNEYRFNSRLSNNTSICFSNTNFRNPTIRNYERKTEQGFGVRSVTKYKQQYFTGIFGAEYQYSFTNTSTFGNKLGVIDTLQYHDEINARQFNIFLQGDFNLPAGFILNAGISYNNFHYGFTRLNQLPAAQQSSDFKPQFIPRISVLKKIASLTSVYAAVSKGYSPPSIDEVHAGDGIFNRNLQAETGINYEAGIKTDIIKNKLSLDAAWYFFNLKNTIVSRRDATGADYFVNAGKTKQQGIEIAMQYLPINNSNRFTRQLKIWANYTNIHARFEHYEQGSTKYDGNKLTGTSPNIFAGGADIYTSPGLYMNLSYSYTDQIALNDANSFYATAYNLFFAKIGFKVNLAAKLSTDLFFSYDHSFNSPYSLGNDLNAAGNRFFNPSSPQNFYGGVKLKFILQ